MKRVLLAGLLGALAFFVWSSLAHIILPLGETGVKEIPNEAPVLSSLQGSIGASHGFYIYPGTGLGPDATREQKSAAMSTYDQKLATTPSGILIYHPPGEKTLLGRKLGTEFLTELIQALILAFALSQTRLSGLPARVGLAVLLGVASAFATNVPYWNWYGFPGNYTLAYMTIQIVAYLLVGVVVAGLLAKSEARSLAAAAN